MEGAGSGMGWRGRGIAHPPYEPRDGASPMQWSTMKELMPSSNTVCSDDLTMNLLRISLMPSNGQSK